VDAFDPNGGLLGQIPGPSDPGGSKSNRCHSDVARRPCRGTRVRDTQGCATSVRDPHIAHYAVLVHKPTHLRDCCQSSDLTLRSVCRTTLLDQGIVARAGARYL
jgi:hypothetical protein